MEASAMQSLGKTINPFSGKIEKNLDQAKMTIDMVEMIERKTQGNRTEEEDKFLMRILYNLRMNYVEERQAEEKGAAEKAAESDQEKPPDGDKPNEDSDSDGAEKA